MDLFLRSEAPGLVFSAIYPWGSSAPSAFPACGGAAASPTDKSRYRGPNEVGDFAEPEGRGKVKDGGLPPVT